MPANPRYLFPVRALSPVFRAKFISGLERAFDQQQLPRDEIDTENLMASLRSKSWVVYTKRPFAGPESVIQYLGRYTHRIAISNHRLLRLQDGVVHFQWRDYRDHDQVKIMKLPASEFLRRFLLHVLPGGFMRIRHFGLLANRHRKTKLERCRALLNAPPLPSKRDESVAEMMARLTGQDIAQCPFCGEGNMRITRPLPSCVSANVPILDSS